MVYRFNMLESGRLAIVKLGGSVITHKHQSPPQSNSDAIHRIAQELATYQGRLVIVLGGGAHGHQAARQYGYGDPFTGRERLLEGIPLIRHNMTILSLDVEQSLREVGHPAVVMPPFCIAQLQDEEIVSFNLDTVKQALSRNCVVVTHGDVCMDTSRGASILSGDSIVRYLAQNLAPEYVIIGTDVDGLFDDDPQANTQARLIPVIDKSNRNEILESAGPSLSTDVTGGMTKKMTELLSLRAIQSKIIILNLSVPHRLEYALADKAIPCTRIIPD